MPPSRLLALFLLMLSASALAAEPPGAESGAAAQLSESYGRYQAALEARDLESAAVHARRAYQLAQTQLEPDDLQLGILAFNLGAVSLELRRYSDAVAPLEQAVRIYRIHYGEYDPRNVVAERSLAESLEALGRWEAAERHYVRAVQLIERERGRDAPELAPLLIELGNIASERDAWKRARTYGLRGIRVLTRSKPEDETPLGLLHVRLAGIELRLGDALEAAKHMDAGLEILEAKLPEDDSRWGQIYVLASRTYGYAGRDSTSRRYKRSARQLGYEVPEDEEEEE